MLDKAAHFLSLIRSRVQHRRRKVRGTALARSGVVRVPKVRCVYEGDFFPTEDFEETARYGLVHGKNLRAGTPRHTTNGYLLHDAREDTRPMWVGPGSEDDDSSWVGPDDNEDDGANE
jgi:hypothetical protein